MRSVADLTAHLVHVTSLVTVRETVYILGGNSSIGILSSYPSIVAISLLDDKLHVVTQSYDEGKHTFGFSLKLLAACSSFPHLY